MTHTNKSHLAGLPAETDEFEAFFQVRFGRYFARRETREKATKYLQALLAQVERTSSRQIAKATGEVKPRAMQRLLFGARWDEEAVRDELQRFIVEQFGDQEGIGMLGEITFLKKGGKSAGVQRQFNRSTGRMANCQIGVFLAYAALNSSFFLDRRLYLPQEWAMDMERRVEAKVPMGIKCRTKPDLAFEMLQNAWSQEVSIRWVVGDETFGDDVDLRNTLSSSGHLYVLGISRETPVMTDSSDGDKPVAITLSALDQHGDNIDLSSVTVFPWAVIDLVAGWPDEKWGRLVVDEGVEGACAYDWARERVVESRGEKPRWELWLLARRSVSQRGETTYFFSNAPLDVGLETLARVASSHCLIHQISEEARRQVGLDDYKVRYWRSWYRHITLSMLAHTWHTWVLQNLNRENDHSGSRSGRLRRAPPGTHSGHHG